MFLGVRDPGLESVMFLKSWLVLDLTQVRFIDQGRPPEHPTMWSMTQFFFALEPLLTGPFLPMCQSTLLSYSYVYLCICSFIFSETDHIFSRLQIQPYSLLSKKCIKSTDMLVHLTVSSQALWSRMALWKSINKLYWLGLPSLCWSCCLQLLFPALSNNLRWKIHGWVGNHSRIGKIIKHCFNSLGIFSEAKII